MKHERAACPYRCTRRSFLQATALALPAPLAPAVFAQSLQPDSQATVASGLAFTSRNNEFPFDTGALRGTLRAQGISRGLIPLIDRSTGAEVARGAGLFSHYRLLDAERRYGTAAWDWASQSRLLPDGSVEVVWSADRQHPLDLSAIYRWAAPHTLDVTTCVTAQKTLRRFESFLACYFHQFPASFVYVQSCPETGGRPGLFSAQKSYADWQMFPRDDQAIKTIGDGRWTRPPHPVNWWVGPQLAAPLAVRRDPQTGLAALVMAPTQECFAVATPYAQESHRSIYLSLFGGDLLAGQKATARSRLTIQRGISDQQAIGLYEAYLAEI